MRLSELQSKNIVSIDGKLIGNIIDVIVESGFIKYLIVEKGKFMTSIFTSKSENQIAWDSIKTIGKDVIIVDCKPNSKI